MDRGDGLRGVALGFVFGLPLRFQPGQLDGVEAVGAGGARIGPEAFGRAVAQQEHQQPVVVNPPRAHHRAEVVHGHFHAMQRAVHRDILKPLHPQRQRGIPRGAELARLRVAAQLIGAFGRHVHRVRGALDAAGIGQRLDKPALALGRPAIVAAGVPGHGRERRQGLR